MKYEFKRGDPVIYTFTNSTSGLTTEKLLDFGYYTVTEGNCICYEPGECNMQDAWALEACKLRRAR